MGPRATDVTVGERRSLELFDDLSRTQLVMYSGASGDYNPLHSDHRYATEIAGYPGIFAHGMLTMGASGRVITDWFGADCVKRYACRFVGQVWPGDRLTVTATVDAVGDADGRPVADLTLVTVNGNDETVVTGSATVWLD